MTINATLVCGRCKAATLHIFMERRPQKRRPGEFAYVDLVYECDRCGSTRVWGSEPRQATAAGRRLEEEAFAHAVDDHGMKRQMCAACRGLGLDCSECDGEGQVWAFESLEPCGPECPLRTAARRGHE
jgi:hypothetical protein